MTRHPLYNERPEPPKPPSTTYSRVIYAPERGGCLSLWVIAHFLLVGILTFGLVWSVFRLADLHISFDRLPRNTQLILIAGVVLALVWAACLIGVWLLKRWGVYGAILASFVNLGLEITLSPQTLDPPDFVIPFISSGILLYIAMGRWQDFD